MINSTNDGSLKILRLPRVRAVGWLDKEVNAWLIKRIALSRTKSSAWSIRVREYDSVFCANSGCVLHVRPGDVNVEGSGNWAETLDGIVTGRQRVGTVMLCDQCVARTLRGELSVQRDCAA